MDLERFSYVWERGQGTEDWIEVRLDRALVFDSFMIQYIDAKLSNLEISTSDHSSIFLEPFITTRIIPTRRFIFENT